MNSGTVYTHPVSGDARPHQFEMHLPAADTNGLLHARLAEVVEQFNASTDPAERVELHAEMNRLRAILNPKGTVRS